MTKIKKFLNENKLINALKGLISNKYYPFITAVVVLSYYYLSLDIISIYYLAINIILMTLLLEDLTPLCCNLPFLHIIISDKNSPSTAFYASDYFFRTHNLIQIIILIGLVILSLALRVAADIKEKRFKINATFISLCFFSIALALNGVFSKGYTVSNLGYGLLLAVCFTPFYAVVANNVSKNNENYLKIGYAFTALSIVLIVELFVLLVFSNTAIIDGAIIHGNIKFGWGTCNNLGMLLTLCMPAVFMLAAKHERGYLFFAYSFIILLAALCTTSRQTILCSLILFPTCLIITLLKGKHKNTNILITIAFLISFAILFAIFNLSITQLFSHILDGIVVEGELSGSGRINLYKTAFEQFTYHPVFGAGFFIEGADPLVGMEDIIPFLYHNTIMQLLGGLGIFGILTYALHRVFTLKEYFKKPNLNRIYAGLIIAALLFTSLFDNHIFYVFPTLIYSTILPFTSGQK